MKYKVITPVSTEPVSLAEAKTHIRALSESFADDMTTTQSIVPGTYSAATYTGAAVDVLGYQTLVTLNTGTCSGTLTAKVQHSDDTLVWEDYESFTVVTAANDNAVQEIEYTDGKQYVRVYATVATASCEFSANVETKTGDVVEDGEISDWITDAREFCEEYTGRALATQTLEALLPDFPCKDRFELPMPPLQSVTSVKYTDSDGDETTMTVGTDYIVDADSPVNQIVLPYSKTWPSFTPYPVNAVRVRYITGYSDSNLIPKGVKQAMLLLIGYWYKNRDGDEDPKLWEAAKSAAYAKMAGKKVWFF